MAEPLPKSVRIFAIVWTGLVAMTTVGWFGVWLAVRDGKPQTDLWKSALLYGLLGVPVGTLGTAKATRSLKMRDDPEAQLVEQ
jgi:type VI protein secretion system component VasK